MEVYDPDNEKHFGPSDYHEEPKKAEPEKPAAEVPKTPDSWVPPETPVPAEAEAKTGEPKTEPLKTTAEIAAEKNKPSDKEKEGKLVNSPETAEVKSDPLSAVMQKFSDRYNIKAEEFEQIPGFKELTTGQKAMVLENFQQAAYARIAERALERRDKETEEAGFWGKIGRGIFKGEAYHKAERAEAEELFKGGLAESGDLLKEIVSLTQVSRLDATFGKDGKLEILYGGTSDGLSPGKKAVVDDFNKTAGAFVKMGAEWKYGLLEKRKFAKAKEAYEESSKKMLEALGNDRDAVLDMTIIDRNVRMNQLLTTDDDIETAMSRVESRSWWERTLKSTATERGGYMALGAVARSLTVGALGFVAAPAVAASMAGISARQRAIEQLREEAQRAELGGGQRLTRGKEKTDLLNVVTADHLTKRLENLLQKLDKASTEEEAKDIRIELKNRLFYTQTKLESGLVNYGKEKERITGQYLLLSARSRAEAEAALAEPEVNAVVKTRLNEFLSYKEGKVHSKVRHDVLKGAMIGAGFAVAGYAIRDAFSGFKGVENILGAKGAPATETAAGIHGATAPDIHPNIEPMHGTPAPHEFATTQADALHQPAPTHFGPMPHEAVQHAANAEAIPRGEVIPEHGNVWEAAKSIGLNQKEFTDAWASPESVIHTAQGPVQIHNLYLVHPGDTVQFFPGGKGLPGHFEVFAKSGQPMGTGLPIEHIGKVQPMPMTEGHLIETNFGGHTPTAAPEHIGPLADHPPVPGGEELHRAFGPASTGHENVAGYPDHYPPQIPTHPDHPPGNPIWENQPTHVADHIAAVPEHPGLPHEVTGAVEVHPGSLADTMVAKGYTGAEYMSHDYRNDVLSYALAHHLNMQVEMDKFQMFGQKLAGNIKLYEQIHADPSKLKEASALLQSIKESIGQAAKTYGSGVIDKAKLPDFLK